MLVKCLDKIFNTETWTVILRQIKYINHWMYTYLNVSSFFDGINKFKLKEYLMATNMDTRNCTDHYIDLLHSFNEATMIVKRTNDEMSSLLLKVKQHLDFFNVWRRFLGVEGHMFHVLVLNWLSLVFFLSILYLQWSKLCSLTPYLLVFNLCVY